MALTTEMKILTSLLAAIAWWHNLKLEFQREGGVGTRGGMFMDW